MELDDYISRAAGLAGSAARLSLKISESLVEKAADLGFEASDQHYDTAPAQLGQTKRLLNAASQRDVLEGLKIVVAVTASCAWNAVAWP